MRKLDPGSKLRKALMLQAVALGLGALAQAAEIQVFAAASLADALKEIAAAYEKASGDTLRFNLAGSSVLARQIQAGAPADVFLSADEAKMDALQAAGFLVDGTRRSFLSNALAVVTPAGEGTFIRSARDLADPAIKRLALAEPSAVPAGLYAKEYLAKAGLWDAVKDRVVPTENVRAALAAVEAGNADAAIVYRTDAAASKAVAIAFEVPVDEGPAISYSFAVVKGSRDPRRAEGFLDYLESSSAAEVFGGNGFIVNPRTGP